MKTWIEIISEDDGPMNLGSNIGDKLDILADLLFMAVLLSREYYSGEPDTSKAKRLIHRAVDDAFKVLEEQEENNVNSV